MSQTNDTARATPIRPSIAACALLDQCAGLIRHLDDACYTAPSPSLGGGTIGKHVRHCLDHFAAASAAATTATATAADESHDDNAPAREPGRVIDYDHRERDVPEETSRSDALRRIDDLRRALLAIQPAQDDAAVTVRVMLSADGVCADLSSTLAREVAFATHHALHHHAMIGAICVEHGRCVPAEFGRAPSTLHHERDASGAGSPARPITPARPGVQAASLVGVAPRSGVAR